MQKKTKETVLRSKIVGRMTKAIGLKTQKELSGKLKITPSQITSYIARDDSTFYKRICSFATKHSLSINWLLTGEEPFGSNDMLHGNVREPEPTYNTSKAFPSIRIPIVTIAGANTDLGRTAFYPCEPPYEYKTVENCRSVEVSGDSMSPAIMDGQTVIYSEEDSIKNGDLAFAILTDGSQLIKKYHKDEKSGIIVFQSINPRDNEQVLTKGKDIRELYKVVGVLF